MTNYGKLQIQIMNTMYRYIGNPTIAYILLIAYKYIKFQQSIKKIQTTRDKYQSFFL